MNPLISVIIPIYKVENYLKSCIDSVLSQTYSNLEIILVDDGSPDNCPQICDDYKSVDDRIIVIHKINGGLSDARNVGLENAKGEYVLFLDSDDLWTDVNGITNIVRILSDFPQSDLVFFQKYSFADGKLPSTPSKYTHLDCNLNGADKQVMLNALQKRSNYLTSAYTKLIRKDLLTLNDIRFEKGLLSEDFDWSMDLYIKANNIVFSDEIFYAYRVRSGSITKSVGLKHINDLFWIYEKWLDKLKNLSIDQDEKYIYYDLLCFVYTILLANINLFNSEHRNFLKIVSKKKSILRYARNSKTKFVAKMTRCIGVYLTNIIMHFFIKFR